MWREALAEHRPSDLALGRVIIIDPRLFYFPIITLDADGKPDRLRGNAFPITANGDLLTCRHVVSVEEGTALGVIDRRTQPFKLVPIRGVVYPSDADLDLALLPKILEGGTKQFPIRPPGGLMVGEDIDSYGFYSTSSLASQMVDGYFRGHVVAFRTDPRTTITMSYPVIELPARGRGEMARGA